MGTVMITMYCMLCTLFKRRHFRAEELERFGDILRLTKQATEQRGVSRMQRINESGHLDRDSKRC